MAFDSKLSVLPPECIAARDLVLFADVGTGPFLNTTYGLHSPAFPNPLIAIPELVGTTLMHFNENLSWRKGLGSWCAETWEQHYTDFYVSLFDFSVCLLFGIILTVIRYSANLLLLNHIPVWFNCDKSEGEKFPEAAFRAFIYSFCWTWTSYIMFKHDYFYCPYKAMIDFSPGVSVPDDVYWLYVLEIGLYLHSIYATLFIEVVRRDFVVQLIHHVVTIMLLGYSYCVRLYGFGILVLFMHDGGDALLESAKCCVYFKKRNNQQYKLPDLFANILFGLFVLSWILFRLYWLLVKAMYTTGHVSKNFLRVAPHYILPNLLLWILYCLHWYWFYYISKLVIHVVTGNEVVDNRDYEEDEKKDN